MTREFLFSQDEVDALLKGVVGELDEQEAFEPEKADDPLPTDDDGTDTIILPIFPLLLQFQ